MVILFLYKPVDISQPSLFSLSVYVRVAKLSDFF